MQQVDIPLARLRDPFEKNVPGDWNRPRWVPHSDAMGRDGFGGFSNGGPLVAAGGRFPNQKCSELTG